MLSNIEITPEIYEKNNKVLIIKFNGELDTTNATDVLELLEKMVNEDYKEQDIIIADFENLSYLNSTGIGVLLHFNNFVKEQQKNFALINVNDNIYDIISIIGASTVLDIHDSIEDALKEIL